MTTIEAIKGLLTAKAAPPTVSELVSSMTKAYDEYKGTLKLLLDRNVELSTASRIRILATAWYMHDWILADNLLGEYGESAFNTAVVVAAVKLLDARRLLKQTQSKMETFKKYNPQPNAFTMRKLDAVINSCNQILVDVPLDTSISGSTARHIIKWVKTIPKEKIEYYAVNMPKKPWQELADILHIKPTDFVEGCEWFLPFCFGTGQPPDGSSVATALSLNRINIVEVLKSGVEVPYTTIRRIFETNSDHPSGNKFTNKPRVGGGKSFNKASSSTFNSKSRSNSNNNNNNNNNKNYRGKNAAANTTTTTATTTSNKRIGKNTSKSFKSRRFQRSFTQEKQKSSVKIPQEVQDLISAYLPLDTLIWWYNEELFGTVVEKRIQYLLRNPKEKNAELTLGYGKLLERIMAFESKHPCFLNDLINAAQRSISGFNLPLPKPVVVVGDASSSMQVAITTANIIGSMICILAKAADLIYFNTNIIQCPGPIPTDINGVIRVSKRVLASGSTSPAAALWPYYNEKKLFDCFVMVTDEEENSPCNGYNFAPLWQKYLKEVNANALLIFISFLRDPNKPGQMVKALAELGLEPTYQLRLNSTQPDLTRLDGFLGRISTERGTAFQNEVEANLKNLTINSDKS